MKDIEVTFPLIEDITMEVAKKYGMIQPGKKRNTKSSKSCFLLTQKALLEQLSIIH